ncbi:MAG: JmjC domain-containing protein [Nannocystaceae bacterium]
MSTLLDLGTLDTILGTSAARFPDIRLVNHAREIRPEEYTWSDQRVDPLKAARLFTEGATLIYSALHVSVPTLQELCAAMSLSLGAKTQANIYLTPPAAQGFPRHWDRHDVLIVQVEGSKTWRMYEGGPAKPGPGEHYQRPEQEDTQPPATELTLRAGDWLYVPRGTIHECEATDESSLHITFGWLPYTWRDLFVDLLEQATAEHAWLREELPCHRACWNDRSASRETVALRIRELLTALDPGAAADLVRDDLIGAHRPATQSALRDALGAMSDRSDTAFEGAKLRPGLLFSLSQAPDEPAATLRAGGRRIAIDGDAADLAQRLLSGAPKHPDDDDATIGLLSRALVREGILTTNHATPTIENDA